ncbi:drebrin isoform X2 [Heterocephalus glaber]|uniref:Drebrin n=1 Tax=Heterocephalus glaber TaxID=10181 RepID=A0A0P6J871_HETGA|nr:drebrin isoform X2 [Heterocephalus glaber]
MAGVSFSGHRMELLAAYEDVIREESSADWALYTYEDGSDDLKLAASGEGGLQELSGHFENQKVMYGFCSVKDSQAALPKYVLINWVGEDVPDARKCACASHVAKVAEFFQGVDVIVNASSVEDIDAGAIGQRLSNGLARLSSPVLHRLRLREDENAEPVGTTYQKTDAAVEMKRINREQFWEQAKKEEELRKEEERKKALDARLRFEQERMEQERQEQEERERRYREREQQIEEHRRKQQTLEAEEAKRRLKEQSIFGDQQEEEEEETQMKKSESEVEEAAAIIAQRPDNPREFFKQQERVASASAGSCDVPSPFNHRSGSHLDSHRRMAPTPIPARSPSDSSTASTPITEQIERALDEVTSSQPPPLPPPPPPAPETKEPSPSLDTEETCKEARAAGLQAWAGPMVEASQAQELPQGQGSAVEDLMFMESPAKADLAAPVEPATTDTTGANLSEADTHTADTIEITTDTTVANNITPGTASLVDLWPGNGEGVSAPQAEPRAPTLPLGAEATLAEVPLLDEVVQEPLLPVGEGCANLLNFDELPEPPATFCDPEEEVGEPLVAPQAPTLPSSLEEVDREPEPELEQEPHLLTNGETTQKEGTQASEGYFSQSQEEEFAQSEELCAKAPPPVFYNKPPEIDITCWDADPVPEEEEGFEGGD